MLLLLFGALVGRRDHGLLEVGLTKDGYLTIAIVAGIMFYLPDIAVAFLASSRKQKIFLSMPPDCLDLLVRLGRSRSGTGYAERRRIAEELVDTAPELCNELNLANMQLQMGRVRREVLHDLGVRTGCDDMKALGGDLDPPDQTIWIFDRQSVASSVGLDAHQAPPDGRRKSSENRRADVSHPVHLPGFSVVLVGQPQSRWEYVDSIFCSSQG